MRNYLLDGSEKLLEPTIFFNLNTKFKYLFAIKLISCNGRRNVLLHSYIID